jgi:hypothetical protein
VRDDAVTDRDEIVAQTIAYCWAIDFGELTRLDDIFLPECTAVLGSTTCADRGEILAKITGSLGPLDGSQHIVANHEVQIIGDTAVSRCYLHAQHIRHGLPGGELLVVAGRYEDRWTRTADGWRISHRDLIPMWRAGNPDVLRR